MGFFLYFWVIVSVTSWPYDPANTRNYVVHGILLTAYCTVYYVSNEDDDEDDNFGLLYKQDGQVLHTGTAELRVNQPFVTRDW